jgi:hypothetical protein
MPGVEPQGAVHAPAGWVDPGANEPPGRSGTEDLHADNREQRWPLWTRKRPHSLNHVSREILEYSAGIGAVGLGPASRGALERWAFFPRVEAHGAALRILTDATFVAFGNGLCGLEIPLFGSLLDRDDVLFVGGGSLARSTSRFGSAPLDCPNRPGLAADKTTSPLGRPAPADRRALFPRGADDPVKQAAEALSAGTGAVYVLPRGLRCDRKVWDQIGCIIERLLATQSAAPSALWLVPMVYQVSPIHVLASRLLPRRSTTRFLARVRAATWTGLPAVFIPQPVAVSELQLPAGATAEDLGRRVGELWMLERERAREAIPRWTPFAPWSR